MKKNKKHQDLNIDDLYENDPWVREFMITCFDIHGAPKVASDCLDYDEEIYHTFCSLALIIAMKKYQQEWASMKNIEPVEAAYQFSEMYFNVSGDWLIPPVSYDYGLEEVGGYCDVR